MLDLTKDATGRLRLQLYLLEAVAEAVTVQGRLPVVQQAYKHKK